MPCGPCWFARNDLSLNEHQSGETAINKFDVHDRTPLYSKYVFENLKQMLDNAKDLHQNFAFLTQKWKIRYRRPFSVIYETQLQWDREVLPRANTAYETLHLENASLMVLGSIQANSLDTTCLYLDPHTVLLSVSTLHTY